MDLFERMVSEHLDHPWYAIGRCVYCGPCEVRLYQGHVPPDHPVYEPPKKPNPVNKMRDRWGMDERPSRSWRSDE